MAANYYTVDKIIREILGKMGEDSLHHYERLLPHAYDFLDQFRNDGYGEVRTIRLDLPTSRTVKLPVDFVNFTKVGVQVGDKVRLLSYNNQLANLPACPAQSGGVYRPIAKDEPITPFINYERELLGYGQGGYDECFSINQQARLMVFGTAVNVGRIYLEYISSEIDLTCETPVNPLAKPAMENYILWKFYQFRKDGVFKTYEDYYYNELRKLKDKLDPFSIADIYQLLESNYSPYPKG